MEFSISVTYITECPFYAGFVLGVWDVNEQKRQKKNHCHGTYILVRDRKINNKHNK